VTKNQYKGYLVIAGTGHCLECGKDCRAAGATPESYKEVALCMCADCGLRIDDDAVLIAVAPASRGNIDQAKGTVQLQPGLWATLDGPGVRDAEGKLVSRPVTLRSSASQR
jgi:hypothetical protein